MKQIFKIIAVVALFCGSAKAVDPHVTYTVQALSGLQGDTPRFVKVYCHDVGLAPISVFTLICARNVPSTNSERELQDHNILSGCGVKIRAGFSKEPSKDGKTGMGVVLDLRSVKNPVPETHYGGSHEDLIRIAFECIRMAAALRGADYHVTVEANADLAAVAQKVSAEFDKHNKAKRFTGHPGRE